MKLILSFLLFNITHAQDFRPNVYVQCLDGVLAVTVSTIDPFHGVVYTEGHRESCSEKGMGFQRTSLLIPLTGFAQCGIVYRHWEEQYYVLVNVRQHAMIILQQDRTFNVSCPKEGGIERRNDSDPAAIQLGLFSKDKYENMGIFGQPYLLRVWASADDKFTVSTCMGFAGTNQSVQLTDDIGCSVNPELVGNFDYDDEMNTASAPIESMFKFPLINVMHIQCAVLFCQDKCRRVDCERRRSVLEQSAEKHKMNNLIQRRFASTTITVEEVGGVTREVYQSTCPYHTQLMAALCILFAALFIGALIINMAFCALGGYCCCRDEGTASLSTMEYINSDTKKQARMDSKLTEANTPPFTIYDVQRHHTAASSTAYAYCNADYSKKAPPRQHHSPTTSHISDNSHHSGINDRLPLIKVVDADRPRTHQTETMNGRVMLAGDRKNRTPIHIITTQGTAF